MEAHVREIYTSLTGSLTSAPLCYLSTPITSGYREFVVMERYGANTVSELREKFPNEWKSEVLRENEDSALRCEAQLKDSLRGYQVLNPAHTSEEGWTQNCYDDLWANIIRAKTPLIAVAPHWAFSRGARKEISLAFTLGLSFVLVDGTPQTVQEMRSAWEAADRELTRRGWNAALSAPLPELPVLAA